MFAHLKDRGGAWSGLRVGRWLALGGLLVLATTIGLLMVEARHEGTFASLEDQLIDLRFAIRGSQPTPADVVVVGIDDATLAQIGVRWPFPRSYYARMIDRLRAAGARTIVYDLEFIAPTTAAQDNALISAAAKARNVVFATSLVGRNGATNVLGGNQVLRRIHSIAGDADFPPDSDGVVRRLLYSIDGLRSLAVVAAQRYLGHRPSVAGFGSDGALIDFRGPPGTVRTLSFLHVLAGHFNPGAVRGKVVVIGTTSSTLHDLHATSTAPNGLMSGAELQANAIDTVLRGEPLREAPDWLATLVIMLLAFVPVFAWRLGTSWILVTVPVAVVALFVASQIAFDLGLVLPTIYPAVAIVISGAVTIGISYVGAQRERRRLRALFAAQTPEVIEAVLDTRPGSPTSVLRPTEIVAGYRLERVIGRGGLAVVYLSNQLQLDRSVALKLMSPQYAQEPEFRERFVRESRAAASIEHPNVIPVYEAGEDNGLLFIAMRYVDGIDLRAKLDRDGGLEPASTVALARQLAGALDAAHARGLVHRDVKPANVLLSGAEVSHVYLTDFGIATRAGALTRAGGLIGTPLYIAPEQIEGKQLDGRADQYSLGCLVYEALTGTPPFAGRELQVLWAHVHKQPPPITERLTSLPPAVDRVLLRALAKDPASRFETAGKFVDELQTALETDVEGEPVEHRGHVNAQDASAASSPRPRAASADAFVLEAELSETADSGGVRRLRGLRGRRAREEQD